MIFHLAVDVLIGLAGVTVGYVQAMRTMNRKPVKHKHAFGEWTLTGETVRDSDTRYRTYPVQQRECLGCGYVQREAVEF